MTPADLQTALAENFTPWVLDLGLTVEEPSQAHVLTRMLLTPRLARAGGIVSGQALVAIADTSMILAASASRGAFTPCPTTNLDMVFLRPGSGSAILCRAEAVRSGKAFAFMAAQMAAADTGKPVATATATLFSP